MERVAFRPLRGANPATLLIASFAVSYGLQNLAILIEGSAPQGTSVSTWLSESVADRVRVDPEARRGHDRRDARPAGRARALPPAHADGRPDARGGGGLPDGAHPRRQGEHGHRDGVRDERPAGRHRRVPARRADRRGRARHRQQPRPLRVRRDGARRHGQPARGRARGLRVRRDLRRAPGVSPARAALLPRRVRVRRRDRDAARPPAGPRSSPGPRRRASDARAARTADRPPRRLAAARAARARRRRRRDRLGDRRAGHEGRRRRGA